jgi:hypothetical protein
MKRSAGEENQGQRPYKPFFKWNPPFKAIEPPQSNLKIDLGNVASDSFCTYHQENHSERECPQWVHAMNVMANQFLDEVSLTEQSSSSAMNIFDQEEVDPPEETTMLIWDPDIPMPFDDLFVVQEPPVEILVMKTQSRGQPISNNLTTTQNSRGKPTLNHSKSPFSPQINPISIHTRESPKIDYNIVEYLKKLKENISLMYMCRIHQQKGFLLQALKSVEIPTISTHQGENITPTDPRNKPTMNACSKVNKGKPFVPSFLLKFEVFSRNLHNCLVDLGASSNVMSLSICKKLNIVPLKRDKHVIQLDRTHVKVMGELKDVMIKIETHPKFLQVINIIIVDIPEDYGLLLSQDWYEKLKGYFSID